MRKKLQIFISSTYIDMKEERQAAVEAILKSGNIPAGMELFTSGNESQLQTIMRWIDESDIYVLLLGGRYGSIENSSGISYTEVEYDYAVSQKKPYFAIVITDEALRKKVKEIGIDATENLNPNKLKEFREKVLSNISSFYEEPKDIKLGIHETLQDFKDRFEFSGWVTGSDMEKFEILLEENRNLRLKIEKLLSDSAPTNETAIQKKATKENIDDESSFYELIELFSNMTIKTDKFPPDNQMKEYSIVEVLIKYRGVMISGIYNKYDMSERDKVLFFNVFPKLATHELAENETVTGVKYRRFALNKKGLKLLAFIDKKINAKKK